MDDLILLLLGLAGFMLAIGTLYGFYVLVAETCRAYKHKHPPRR